MADKTHFADSHGDNLEVWEAHNLNPRYAPCTRCYHIFVLFIIFLMFVFFFLFPLLSFACFSSVSLVWNGALKVMVGCTCTCPSIYFQYACRRKDSQDHGMARPSIYFSWRSHEKRLSRSRAGMSNHSFSLRLQVKSCETGTTSWKMAQWHARAGNGIWIKVSTLWSPSSSKLRGCTDPW